jgi:hypothetical protein
MDSSSQELASGFFTSRARFMCGSAKGGLLKREYLTDMNDLIFVGIIVAFFVLSALYVRFCEKL